MKVFDKRYKKIFNVILALMAALLFITLAPLSAKADASTGNVTLSIEKFTLGQGFVQQPVSVPIYSGETVGEVVSTELGTDNFKDTGALGTAGENISDLSSVKDNDSDSIDPPQYITNMLSENGLTITGRQTSGWLGEFDYTTESGWVYTVNNLMPDVGMSSYVLSPGDIIRVQFSLVWGDDISANWTSNTVNRDNLAKEIASVNSASDKDELLANTTIDSAYKNALTVMADLTQTQTEVDSACATLSNAIESD
ncbi:DUF4430 domain-containing protein, partial [Oenococcus oeni]